MKKKINKVSANYLDYIPLHGEKHSWETDDGGRVAILVENKGPFNRVAQLLFKKPKVTKVHLDKMGNFIWPLIDGNNTVGDIADRVHEEFGEKAEPLYNRLVTYMQTMESYDFITMRKPESSAE